MPMAPLNDNSIQLHTAVRRSQRGRLNHLAATPGLTSTGTATELLSLAAYEFLSRRPFDRDDWVWLRPEGYYRYVEGQRIPNDDWVALNPYIADVQVHGRTISAVRLEAGLRALAAQRVPKLRSTDTGMNALVYTLIHWMLNNLHPQPPTPAAKSASRALPDRTSSLAAQVRDAQATVASWPPEKRANVQLEGSDFHLRPFESKPAVRRRPKL